MKPRVGKSVHYVSYGSPGGEFKSKCRAAIVAEVLEPSTKDVSLVVLNPNGLFFNVTCPQDEEEKKGGTWHFKKRCDD